MTQDEVVWLNNNATSAAEFGRILLLQQLPFVQSRSWKSALRYAIVLSIKLAHAIDCEDQLHQCYLAILSFPSEWRKISDTRIDEHRSNFPRKPSCKGRRSRFMLVWTLAFYTDYKEMTKKQHSYPMRAHTRGGTGHSSAVHAHATARTRVARAKSLHFSTLSCCACNAVYFRERAFSWRLCWKSRI